MNTLNFTPTQLLAGLGVLLALLVRWRFGAQRARPADVARSSARLVSLTARVLFNAGLIAAAQWAVFGFADSVWLRLTVLGPPAPIVHEQARPPRCTFADYLGDARAVWSADVAITLAWIRPVTGCLQGLSSRLAKTLAEEVGEGGDRP